VDEAGRIVEYSDYGIIRQLRADVIHMSLSKSIRKDLFFFVVQSGKHIITAANPI
jgi:hypothetical protein